MKEKLLNLIEELNKGLIEREDTIKIALLTMLAQENLILIGPPGTAKSEISRRMAQAVKGDDYFEYLLTKFTTPEEIFGPLSIKELKEDKFKRNTDGYLPSAKIAFLDEIFKANSSILNSLLTIINEKKYHNGKEKMDVPLLSMVGASNELPVNDEDLKALYDRFLVRKVVDYISDEKISELMEISGEECKVSEHNRLTIDEMKKIREESKNIIIPDGIKSTIEEIRRKYKEEFKENSIEDISDRRLIKIVKLLKVSAHTNGRKEVDISDVILLRNCLWNDSENTDKTGKIVTDIVKKNTKINVEKTVNKIEAVKKLIKTLKMAGDGSKDNPFIIENEHDLYSLHDAKYKDKLYYFEQINDIDLKNIGDWDPISNFKGVYEGNDKKILNLKIIRNNIQNIGLFGIIEKDAEVNNLTLENVNIDIAGTDISEMNIGGISGINKGRIFNIKLKGNINSKNKQKTYSGGITGDNGGNILNSEVIVRISSEAAKHSSSGGITGNNSGSILNSKVSGIISSSSNSDSYHFYSYSGGVTGKNNGKIENTIVLVKEIELNFGYIARIGTISENGKNKNSYAVETVLLNGTAVKSSDPDGVNGKDVAISLLTKTFYERMLKWDFETIWNWDSKANKPILRKTGEVVNEVKENMSENKTLLDLKKIFKDNIWL